MVKINIIEIENSYLNFFTPAIIVVAGYFLINLIGWSLEVIEELQRKFLTEIQVSALNLILQNLNAILVTLLVIFIFIPRLKVQDADYKEPTIPGLFIVAVFLFIAIFFRLLLETVFLILGLSFQHHIPWFLTSYEVLNDPFVLLVFFILAMITSNLFVEFLYRRTLIPLLEDRGLSPFHAVILSSIGFCFLRLPDFLLFPCNFNLYSVILYITFGFCAGLIYILTRNIIYPILFHALYFFHYYIDLLGPILKNSAFIIISDLLNAVALIASIGIMIYGVWEFLDKNSTAEWISILQKRSVPKIKRGLIGFLIISISLLGLNTLVIFIGNEFITRAFPDYFVYIIGFYFIAFSIPFWLTIKTEYATY